MARQPLNEGGGRAPHVGAKLRSDDVERLTRLMMRRRIRSRSEMTRELLRYALDRAEQMDAADN